MWKHFISDYLSFTKKERTGILVLISLIVFFMLLPFLYPYVIKEKTYDHTAFEKEIALFQASQEDSSDQLASPAVYKRNDQNNHSSPGTYEHNQAFKGEMFYFDPNLATPADWKRLGIRDKTIATIQNYLSKGGKFYKKEDIGKIWGLHEDEVQRLMPYVQIQNSSPSNHLPEKQLEKKEYKKTTFPIMVVDINSADTTAFIALPGIGSKLSQRIINFREKLGGFYRIEQISEIFGLPDSTFQKIKSQLKISNQAPRQININTATQDELKSHPYLRYAIANAIVQYRAQHGNYSAVTDLKKIMLITEEVFNKVAPYLKVN
ncbi:MAG: helix-hairpin-helix protein [Ferruginibacter sp.]|nr:helix-hairpin-helix protein [Ferruginibacter sp.]